MGVIGGGSLAIGSLSRQTGSKVETIRYYERIGLLPTPARTASGYRRYDRAHLTRLAFIRRAFIRRARALGFSLDEVRTLLRLADERERPCAEVRVVASAHLEDVRAKIADLQAMERVPRRPCRAAPPRPTPRPGYCDDAATASRRET